MLRHHLDMNILSKVSARKSEMLHIVCVCVYIEENRWLSLSVTSACHPPISMCVAKSTAIFSFSHQMPTLYDQKLHSAFEKKNTKIPSSQSLKLLHLFRKRKKKTNETNSSTMGWSCCEYFLWKSVHFYDPRHFAAGWSFPYSRLCAVLLASSGILNTSTEIGASFCSAKILAESTSNSNENANEMQRISVAIENS